MPPRTRANDNFTLSPELQKGHIADTEKRIYFFDAFDRDRNIKPFRQICRDKTVDESTRRL